MSAPPERHRILVVSAHFPPDFVSGGTIAPDRQARGLQARGHEVSVYAGHLGEDRPPLSTWTTDEDGLSVRWVTSRPWIGWGDERNYDNPAVADDFAAHLRAVRPDIVHLHSLQSLGAGLLTEAKAAGAVTVVTMHDFWWCCARQFLVDRTWVPCSVVVDAGGCECEVGRAALDQRNALLRDRLAAADLVLAPSAITAEVLAANGVPAERLRVDENGLPDDTIVPAPRAHADREPDEPVTFVYAGGSNPMKGSRVLLDAVRRLAPVEGWRLEAYGLEELASTEWRRAPAQVALRPPFSPAELDGVLRAADVVILPSIMRESHSLLTREALLRGAAVICTDSLGPEEVVDHGHNGLIVPSADAEALAAAMRQLVGDHELLARLRAAGQVRVRRFSEQLDGLEAHYRDLLAAPQPPAARPGVGQVAFVCGIDGAPLRYRAHLPAEALQLHGVRTTVVGYRDPSLPDVLAAADAVVVYRSPATVQLLEQLDHLRRTRPQVPLLFDVDDLIFDPDLAAEIPALSILPEDEAALWLEGVRRYRTTMEVCDLFVGSTEMLCQHATAVTGLPSERFANGVGLVLARAADAELRRPRSDGPPRIGYLSGTTTHDRDWAEVEGAVLEVMTRHPDLELWLGGHLNPSPALEQVAGRTRRLPLLDWRALPAVLRDLDVNLAPLEPLGRFNEAKSAIKWLEAALTATPTVASPTEPFREAVDHGVNGLLAESHDEWVEAIDLLVSDAQARARLGHRARRDALLRWSPHRQADRYLEILERAQALVRDGQRHHAPSSFTPVANDEPPMPMPLAPYGPDPSVYEVPPRSSAGRRVANAVTARVRTWQSVSRTEGRRAALNGTARAVRRDARRIAGAVARRLRTHR